MLRIIVFVAVGAIALVVVSRVAGSLVAAWFDRPRIEAPLVLGAGTPAIAVVYHPGGSGFPRRVAMELVERLVARGCSVTLLTAGSRPSCDLREYDAVVLGSPVYLGKTRPVIAQFVTAHAPLSVPTYALLTGWVDASGKQDLAAFAAIVAGAGGRLRGGIKLATGASGPSLSKDIAAFADTVKP